MTKQKEIVSRGLPRRNRENQPCERDRMGLSRTSENEGHPVSRIKMTPERTREKRVGWRREPEENKREGRGRTGEGRGQTKNAKCVVDSYPDSAKTWREWKVNRGRGWSGNERERKTHERVKGENKALGERRELRSRKTAVECASGTSQEFPPNDGKREDLNERRCAEAKRSKERIKEQSGRETVKFKGQLLQSAREDRWWQSQLQRQQHSGELGRPWKQLQAAKLKRN